MTEKGKRENTPLWGRVAARLVRDRELTGADRHVYEALSLFANRQGLAWPKRSVLADLTGLPDRTIGRATAHLVERGHILKVGNGGRGRPSKYLLIQDENPDSGVPVLTAKPGHSPSGFSTTEKPLNPDATVRGKEQTNKGKDQGRLGQEGAVGENVIPFRKTAGGER